MRAKKNNRKSEAGYDRVIKYMGVFGGVQTLSNLITLVKGKLVAHFISAAGMGIAYAFNRTIDLVSKTTDLGISFSAVKTISESTADEARQRQLLIVRSWSLWLGIIGTVACFLLAPLFSRLSFDGDYSYTLSFQLLSLVVGCTSITSGERAIMKGTHLLRQLAANQIWVVVATLVIATPIYMWLGMQGIVPVLVLTAVSTMVLTCWYSFRAWPYRVALFSKSIFREGGYIVRLGINYTIAGFLGTGVLYFISTYVMEQGTAEDVGFYSNAVALSSYLSMLVLSAVETDFFPRLSAVNCDRTQSNHLVNEQIEVLILLISPLIVAFLLSLPLLIPLLLKRSFLPMLEVTQWAALALFFTALTRPMSFISLSKGDSFTYLIQELFYDLFMAAAFILGYRYGGLSWAGVGLFAAAVFDWLLNYLITHVRYGFRTSRKVRLYALLHGLLLAVVMVVLRFTDGWVCWTAEAMLLVASAALSFHYLYKETDFLQRIIRKLKHEHEA